MLRAVCRSMGSVVNPHFGKGSGKPRGGPVVIYNVYTHNLYELPVAGALFGTTPKLVGSGKLEGLSSLRL